MLERLEEVDLAVEALQVLGALQEVVQLHLVPGHLHPLVLVERPVPANQPRSSAQAGGGGRRRDKTAAATTAPDLTRSWTSPCRGRRCTARHGGANGSAIWVARERNRETAAEKRRGWWRYRTLPYRPVGSTSAYSPQSAALALALAPIILASRAAAALLQKVSTLRRPAGTGAGGGSSAC